MPEAAFEERSRGRTGCRSGGWPAAAVTFGIAFIVYLNLLPPTVTFEDAGELIVAADYLGVPHPPGYPVWTLLSGLFVRIFRWVRFFGQPDTTAGLLLRSLRFQLGDAGSAGMPNPAWAVALCSAVFGALACGAVACLVARIGADALRGARRRGLAPGNGRLAGRLPCVAGISAGLILAFTPVFWSQSLIAEVYSLNAFFLAAILLALHRWWREPRNRRPLLVMAWLFGLGLANHHTLLFLAPAMALAVLSRDARLFSRFVALCIPLAAVLAFHLFASRAGRDDWTWTAGPGAPAFWIHTALILLIPVIAQFGGKDERAAGRALLLVFLGLAFYLYLPIASDRNPPMNWGYARTWDGFLRLVTRAQYEEIAPASIFSRAFAAQFTVFLDELRTQFTLPILLVGLLPFCAWSFRAGGKRRHAFPAALGLFALVSVMAMPEAALRLGGGTGGILTLALYLFLLTLVLMAGLGGSLLLVAFLARVRRRTRVHPAWAVAGLLPTVALGLGLAFWTGRLFLVLWGGRLAAMEALAVLLLSLAPTVVLAVAWRGRRSAARLRFDIGIPVQDGWLVTLAGFLCLGVVFLVVQNLDIDAHMRFVGRVQFIPAYTVYALWVGFGLLGALVFIARQVPQRPWLCHAAAALVLGLPMAPVWENAFNAEQVRLWGGAEQRRRGFAWQFGDWMLRGEDAVRESLRPEEQAGYPTPGYPPPLKPDAILFGGTDEGRFIPTYMVFSARVRPDIFVVTQNALADGPYLAATRDLYGDRIWIPSRAARMRAFRRFLEARAAAAAGNDAAPPREGERMTVSGTADVMEINARLAREMFEANRERHAFYIEESYAIPWMTEYLEPHGLILRIHPEPVPLCPDRVREDRAFWEWTTARLIHDRHFLRDISARRAFAGLRASLGGFYRRRGLEAEAEVAFLQALLLFPMHTFASYQLADLYLQQGHFDATLRVLGALAEQDPFNPATWGYLALVRDIAASVEQPDGAGAVHEREEE